MAAGPGRPIDGNGARPPRLGLVASAERPAEGDSVWENGVEIDVESCFTPGTPLDPCSPGTFSAGTAPTESKWEPYVLWATYQCSTLGQNLSDARGKARRRLEATSSFQLERELWTGTLSQSANWDNDWLANVANVDILTEAGAVDVVQGLACLTQYLAETNGGSQGMIHAMPLVVSHWASQSLVYRQGNLVLTVARDDIVVPGGGYTGSTPDGAEPVSGNVWAYATDMVQVRLGEVQDMGGEPAQVDRTNNTVAVQAQRLGLASWEGCRHAGAQLDVDVCDVGGS